MMLHRHFEEKPSENMTKLEDFNKKEEYTSEVFPPEEAPKKKTRKK